MALTAIVQQDLSKGTNLVSNPYDINKQQSVLLVNFVLDEHGSLHVRPGNRIQTVAPNTNPIIKLYDYIKPDGTIRKLAILLGTATDNVLYDRGTSPWTVIGTLGTKETLPDFVTFTGVALLVNGYEVPYSLNAAGTLAHLTDSAGGGVPAGAKHHAVHQGYYWVWNTAAITSGIDGPSSLRSSDLNDPNAWPAENQIFIDKDDGDSGQGLGQFTIAESGISPTTSQILFKRFAGYQMTGVFGSTSPAFSIQKIKSDMGCVAPRTIRFAPGFGILRLSHRGVALFNGVDDILVSEEIRPMLFGSDTYTGINWDAVAYSQAEVIANPPLYVLACPVTGTGLTRLFCYDLVRKAWTVLQYSAAIATIQALRNPNTLPVVLIGDYSAGYVRSIFDPRSDDTGTDDGVAIAWQAYLRPVGVPSPQQLAYYARAIVKIFHAVAGQQFFWSVILGPITSTSPATKSGTVTLPADVPPNLAIGGYGAPPYGGPPYGGGPGSGPSSEADVTLGIGLHGTNARLTLSGEGHLVIRGIEYHVAPKPLGRPSVYA